MGIYIVLYIVRVTHSGLLYYLPELLSSELQGNYPLETPKSNITFNYVATKLNYLFEVM